MTICEFEKELNSNRQLLEFMKFIIANREYTDIALERLNECKKTVT